MLPKELALRIVEQRKKLKLSQAAVGDLVGLKQQTISAFENKPENAHVNTLFRILSAVNLDIRIIARNDTSSMATQWKEEW